MRLKKEYRQEFVANLRLRSLFQTSFHYRIRHCLTTSEALGNVTTFVECLPRVHEVLGLNCNTLKTADDTYNPSTWRQENQKLRAILYDIVSLRSV